MGHLVSYSPARVNLLVRHNLRNVELQFITLLVLSASLIGDVCWWLPGCDATCSV